MNQDYSIIILTKENGDVIVHTLDVLKLFSDRHPSLRQIIVADDASKDNTLPSVMDWIHKNCDDKYSLITNPRSIGLRKNLLIALEQVNNPLTVLLDVGLCTRFHQIRCQLKLLKKVDLVIPSRLHRLSKTDYRPTVLQRIITFVGKQRFTDLDNPQKSFRTNKILFALRRNHNHKLDWTEIIAENPSLKVTQCKTHWIERKKI